MAVGSGFCRSRSGSMSASPRLTNVVLLRSGEIAVAHLETKLPQLDALGALIAANFASAREIARLLGERGFESQFQQGAGRQLITQAVGDGWILAVLLPPATAPGVGGQPLRPGRRAPPPPP